MGKYVVNNELTEEAHLTTDLIKRCTFNVGSDVPVRIKDEEQGAKKPSGPRRQHYNRFIDVSYPDGDKSSTVIIPGCVMHHNVSDYYGKPSIYVGVPQSFVREMQLKLSTASKGMSPLFQDKKILSDQKYWWTRCSFVAAEEGKEYIRVFDNPDDPTDPAYYGGFSELFDDYPSSMLANITCTLVLKTDVPEGEAPQGNETWRVGLLVSMFTPYDSIEVPAPSTGIGQKSMGGKKDIIKPGLAKLRRSQPNGN